MESTSRITRSQRKELAKNRRNGVAEGEEPYSKKKKEDGTRQKKPGPKPKRGPKTKPGNTAVVKETSTPAKQSSVVGKKTKKTPLSRNQAKTSPKSTEKQSGTTAKQSPTVIKDSLAADKSTSTASSKSATEKKLQKCYHCDIEFKNKNKFFEHLKSHVNKGYTCKNCKKHFNNKLEWNCHTNIFCKNAIASDKK